MNSPHLLFQRIESALRYAEATLAPGNLQKGDGEWVGVHRGRASSSCRQLQQALAELEELRASFGMARTHLPSQDLLAAEIRRVDGQHRLGAGALAERLHAWLQTEMQPTTEGCTQLFVSTRHPRDYVLINEQDRSRWRGTPEGSWERDTSTTTTAKG